ncbi:MAG: 2-C-methyl-D-erythritol 4-phosphate cytidylyltransferase [Candidatus Omnitrophica bacterium CG_4_10_14_0_2_um_filter_44_9]|nr:MAG: 2-C-methyl-D-erythritol 4-phosphate cytidylyltransferase [Candidatus Omnitrophica bacterium CG_4_10_14_0_8_um_filter_44_12]PIZ84295.1 MAG: 2-C-methyl-D-erythritol 4-phosphate cytidylyltransferase [Candidatus Omnitrophica bacterium CG_4_10_14_0_2_um_filter_44_9]
MQGAKITAIVPAAGLGVRMNLGQAKPLVEIRSKPVIIYTLEVLQAHPLIDKIILVFNKEGFQKACQFVKKYRISKVARVIAGGATRKESVRNGLEAIDPKTKIVVIHDGVRPFVDEGSISRVIEEAFVSGAAVLGVPVKSTIKKVNTGYVVEETLKRERLWEIQTPQAFDRELIQKAYLRASSYSAPDDAALVELMGKKVRVVRGSYFNIKITTQEDLVFAEAIASIKAIE